MFPLRMPFMASLQRGHLSGGGGHLYLSAGFFFMSGHGHSCFHTLPHLPSSHGVKINEVGPRDGLQNERSCSDNRSSALLTPYRRAFLAFLLKQANCHTVEAAAFVREDKVPAMAGAAQVFEHLRTLEGENANKRDVWARYVALVPNRKGAEKAIDAGVNSLAVVTCVSDAFANKNVGTKTWQDNLRLACEAATTAARNADVQRVRGYISCSFACPYDTLTRAEDVAHSAAALADAGCTEIVLGDTDGRASVRRLEENVTALSRAGLEQDTIGVHFHDTFGQALANVYASLALGITSVDASCAGLGGCPFAPGATGNLATEDLAFFAEGAGVSTGVDARRLLAAGRYAHALACGDERLLVKLEQDWRDGKLGSGGDADVAKARPVAGRAARAWPRKLGM